MTIFDKKWLIRGSLNERAEVRVSLLISKIKEREPELILDLRISLLEGIHSKREINL